MDRLRKNKLHVIKQASVYFVLALTVTTGCKRKKIPVVKPGPLAVRVVRVKNGTVRRVLSYVGTIHSRREIRILARLGGKVADLPVPEGHFAKKGEILARIAAPETRARVARLRAEAARARVESRFACSVADTDRKLLKNKAISPIKADISMQKCESSRAALNAILAGLRETMVVQGRSQEKAPFDGMVLKWIAQPGENIMPGRPILSFGGSALEVRVMVQEKDVKQGIKPGEPVLIMPGTARQSRTKVAYVAPMAVGPARLVEVRIPLTPQQAKGLSHGMSVPTAFVVDEEQNAMLVPASAIRRENNKAIVFKVADDRARAVRVRTGLGQGNLVAVRSRALRPGDRVIAGNLDVVRNNTRVYPVTIREQGAGQ